ncbi:hypothetical protein BDZ91DRAFT_195255 [Kalaharituber pfeilii]|nr:hypothetical protein BDZ91DRAFT_195255 [Kalaharituber pfeilii]
MRGVYTCWSQSRSFIYAYHKLILYRVFLSAMNYRAVDPRTINPWFWTPFTKTTCSRDSLIYAINWKDCSAIVAINRRYTGMHASAGCLRESAPCERWNILDGDCIKATMLSPIFNLGCTQTPYIQEIALCGPLVIITRLQRTQAHALRV